MTPAIVDALLKAVASGAPYVICCAAVGINADTFYDWKRRFPDFGERVEKAAATTALRMLKKIEAHGEENFTALSWILERRFPESFSRPEIQLGLTVNNQVTNNTLVITAEVAENLSRRNALINKDLDEISAAYESKQKQLNGSSSEVIAKHRDASAIREVEAESSLVENNSCIELPAPAGRTRGWWSQLSAGDGQRGIARQAAEFVLREIVTGVSGGAKAGGLKAEWDETPTLADLWSAISEVCGEGGWPALVARGAAQEGPGSSPRRERSRKGSPEV